MTLTNLKTAALMVPGFHPDPSICKDDRGHYYLVNSSFEFFPGLPLFESTDLQHWELIGNCLDRPEQLGFGPHGDSAGVYAPTIRFENGTFYLVVTNIRHGNFMIHTTDPRQGWSDPLWIQNWGGIDPSLCFTDDKVYITGNGKEHEPAGIYCGQLDLDTGNVSDRQLICTGTGATDPEGPHQYYLNGKFYLMFAEGGTESGHMVNIARSDSVYGPYELSENNPLLTNRSTHLPLQSIGHADMVQIDADNWWMVFLGVRPVGNYPQKAYLGRETFGTQFTWENGWPALKNASFTIKPETTKQQANPVSFAADKQWITPDVPKTGQYQLAADKLVIHGEPLHLNSEDTAAFIGTRQDLLKFDLKVTLATTAQAWTSGLLFYGNHTHYIELSQEQVTGRTTILRLRVQNGALTSEVARVQRATDAPLQLGVHCHLLGYDFYYFDENGHKCFLGTVTNTLLSFENAGGFTGTLLGFFAHGQGTATFTGLDYHYAD